MNEDAARGPIRLKLKIEDTDLAERLTALLADVSGLRLVGGNEAADAIVVISMKAWAAADGEIPLTPRELEVLTLLAEGARQAVAQQDEINSSEG